MLSSFTIKERALDLGFDLAGIAPLEVSKDLEFSRQWVGKGFNGEMQYLKNPKRFDPRLVLPSAKSVICVGLVYNAGVRSQDSGFRSKNKERSAEAPVDGCNGQRTTDNGQSASSSYQSPLSSFQFPVSAAAARCAWISRYAWGRDYHEIMRAKLEQLRAAVERLAPAVETRVFVDTGPVVERAFARFSGIGWMGKNTCIINQEKGSWFFLGVILTSLELAPDLPAPDRCASCTACLDACPTGALVEPYVMDASRCISYFTIELKGSIPEQFRAKIGANVFGCDICQDVCPWNNSRQLSVLSFQQAASQQRQSGFSYQPSAISYQQTASPQLPSSDKSCVRHAATTKVPPFHPMIVELTHAAPSDGGAPEQLTTNNGRLTTDNGQGTTDHGQQTADTASFSLFNPPLDVLAAISEDDFRRVFAHSPIKRAKYRGWLRNLCVAMGNSGDERFVPWLEHAAQHSDPVVGEHAAWGLKRLGIK
jgi:epoxyqueuosine reductase